MLQQTDKADSTNNNTVERVATPPSVPTSLSTRHIQSYNTLPFPAGCGYIETIA